MAIPILPSETNLITSDKSAPVSSVSGQNLTLAALTTAIPTLAVITERAEAMSIDERRTFYGLVDVVNQAFDQVYDAKFAAEFKEPVSGLVRALVPLSTEATSKLEQMKELFDDRRVLGGPIFNLSSTQSLALERSFRGTSLKRSSLTARVGNWASYLTTKSESIETPALLKLLNLDDRLSLARRCSPCFS